MLRYTRLNPLRRARPGKALSAVQMKALDRRAIARVGIPALCLMENAGRAVADEVARMWKARRRISAPRYVCIVCGNGNNGGDGLVAARHLLNRGIEASVLLVGKMDQASDEFTVNYRIIRKLKVPLFRPNALGLQMMNRSAMAVDALFGIGLSRPIAGVHRRVVEALNASRVPVVAVDVPSGLDATTGHVWGVCVKAAATVTLAYPKQGLFIGAGPRYAGRIRVEDIGIPYSLKIKG